MIALITGLFVAAASLSFPGPHELVWAGTMGGLGAMLGISVNHFRKM